METTVHCQICARDIKAKTGTIAHHGYQRPGNGWQTSSCLGAKYLPYEQSRDRIPQVIEMYKGFKQNNIDREKDLLANPPATITKFARYGFQEDKVYPRPENFSVEKAMEGGSWNMNEYYEMEFKSMVKNRRSNVLSIDREIKFLEDRYKNWKEA